MKGLLGPFGGALASLAMLPTMALAAPVIFTDTEGPDLHKCISAVSAPCLGGAASSGSETLHLNIAAEGFVPNSLITEAKLTLTFADDGGAGDGGEKMDLELDGNPFESNANVNHTMVIEFTDFALLADGKLTVKVTGRSGDFFLEGAVLEIVDDSPTGTVGTEEQTGTAAVPAPAAIAILSAGLLGLGWKRRIGR
jgi:hypothetical protein